jgi:ribonuclease HI
MKNIYVATDKKHTAVLFSKEMVNKYLTFYPTAKFEIVSDIVTAIDKAKPKDYNSPKVFAIKTGKVKGIFFTCEEFNKCMKGVKNSRGKKCNDVEKAYHYIYSTKIPKNLSSSVSITNNRGYTSDNLAYVDGSYCVDNNLMGIAYTIKNNEQDISHSSFIRLQEKGSSLKAELISAMMVIERAMQEGLKDITIVHDNEQIAKIISSKKQKDAFNEKYYNFVVTASKTIGITFQKVKSHSGNAGNNKVDTLAKHKNVDKFLNML